jgi:hypothetical protein
MGHCFGHLSQTGVYFGPTSQQGRISACRADLNQGEGFVVNGSGHQFEACASHANSMDSIGGYSGWLIPGAGNQFSGCRNTYNGVGAGPLYSKVLNGVEFTNTSSVESNHCRGLYVQPTSFTNEAVVATGTQKQQIVTIYTNQDIPGRALTRNIGDFCVENNIGDDPGFLWIRERTATADNRLWSFRVNNPTNKKQLLFTVWSDALDAEAVWGFVTRDAVAISALDLIAAIITLTGDAAITGALSVGTLITMAETTGKIAAGSGSPEGVISAVGGSVYLDGSGRLWVKEQGTGNTGWSKLLAYYAPDLAGSKFLKTDGGSNIVAAIVDLSASADVGTSICGIANGGTGASAASGARTNLSVYSKAEVDTLIAGLQTQIDNKATGGSQTGSTSGHTHTQII